MSVVVDTSIWVEYFRGSGASDLGRLLQGGLVLLAPVVAAELLSAPLSRAERRAVVEVVEGLSLHPTPLSHWCAVGALRAELARAGLRVSTPDAHLAQCAVEVGGLLWSRDAIFRRIAAQSRLTLFESRAG